MPDQSGQVYGLTILSPIVEDESLDICHSMELRWYLANLPRDSRSPFAKISSTYLARLVVMDDVVYVGAPACEEHLKSRYLVFETNFDGDLDTYLIRMATETPEFVDAVWGHCVAYPGAKDKAAFVDYMKKCRVPTTFFFADVNNRTVEQTRRALQTQSAITSFLERYQGRPPAEIQREFTALLASLKQAPLPPPGGEGEAAVVPQEKIRMGSIDVSDIQGFSLRGYNFPYARYMLLELLDPQKARDFIYQLLTVVTTGERWDINNKPVSTVNLGFTHQGLVQLQLPLASLLSFPLEFQQGMKARGNILFDDGNNGPEHWDSVWQEGRVHAWLGINGRTAEALEERCAAMLKVMADTGGAALLQAQDACAIYLDGKPSTQEHFGYTDGFGNPDFLGAERDCVPGQGKLTADGRWEALATGEFLLGYADEAGELPPAPIPHLLGRNGTFMVYRKLHQNVATFRAYLEEKGRLYAGGKEKLAAKFVGRWRDGTPLELSPEGPDPTIVADRNRNSAFTFGADPNGARCPMGAHIRRVHPRDAFGFNGGLINRRRIMRRGLPYGQYVPEGQPVRDDAEHGIIFMALNASIFRQFEFVQQQWVEYGNDAHQGNDRDPLIGNHDGTGRFMVQGSTDPANPPFLCAALPSFVELRGGDYFFVPSLTALAMIATGTVDPR